jgi:hypothetical protein
LSTALLRIPVGVVVERSKALTQWEDYVWRPVAVLPGEPDTPAWTRLSGDDNRMQFYAGTAEVELFRTETRNYRENLTSSVPALWVVLRATDGDPPYGLHLVTADPAEGEAMTEAGNDIVEQLPMPQSIAQAIAEFVAEHHVEREYIRRKRDRADPQAMGRRPPAPRGDER